MCSITACSNSGSGSSGSGSTPTNQVATGAPVTIDNAAVIPLVGSAGTVTTIGLQNNSDYPISNISIAITNVNGAAVSTSHIRGKSSFKKRAGLLVSKNKKLIKGQSNVLNVAHASVELGQSSVTLCSSIPAHGSCLVSVSITPDSTGGKNAANTVPIQGAFQLSVVYPNQDSGNVKSATVNNLIKFISTAVI